MNWEEELQQSITTVEELKNKITLSPGEEEAFNCLKMPFKITPHILKQIINNDPDCKIRKQFIPNISDVNSLLSFDNDYLDEGNHEVCENLVKRYPNKVILLVTNKCAAYCRFCTRKRTVTDISETINLSKAYSYLRNNTRIDDVVVTGGDPLVLSDEELENIFRSLRDIPTIKFIRLNTRIPVTLPSRITNKLILLFKKYDVSYINIHFEHPNEITEETIFACLNLANNGIILGSQTVLLKGINDNSETLKKLLSNLLKIKVRPYYLYQCDKVTGCEPFFVTPFKGVQIINEISKELPGLCIPRFVIDVPGMVGKTTIAPNGIVDVSDRSIKLKNHLNGNLFDYDF